MNPGISNDFIPMVDLRVQFQTYKKEIRAAIDEVLESTSFIMGPNVSKFETEVADYLNITHTKSCASGTDALHLAMRALGITSGDEVITPSFTFAATAEAIRYVDAIPVFVDIDPNTFNASPELIRSAITNKTRAIIIVHLFGQPANMDEICAIAKEHNIYLVEDCAQSFGACIESKMTGTFGDIACFSFFPSKNLGAYGDGGLICTANSNLANQIELLRNHGSPQRYEHTIIGYNSRLDELQASVLRVKLKYIDTFNSQRRKIAERYSSELAGLNIQTPRNSENHTHVYHQYTILTKQRDRMRKFLTENNIASAIYYPSGLHQQNAFVETPAKYNLPVTERVCSECLSLPMYPELSEPQIDRIINTVKNSIS